MSNLNYNKIRRQAFMVFSLWTVILVIVCAIAAVPWLVDADLKFYQYTLIVLFPLITIDFIFWIQLRSQVWGIDADHEYLTNGICSAPVSSIIEIKKEGYWFIWGVIRTHRYKIKLKKSSSCSMENVTFSCFKYLGMIKWEQCSGEFEKWCGEHQLPLIYEM